MTRRSSIAHKGLKEDQRTQECVSERGAHNMVDSSHPPDERPRQVQQGAEKWKYCWLFEVGTMRNTHLKTVRNLWRE